MILFLLNSSCTKEESDCENCFRGKVTCRVDGEKWSADCESVLFGCPPYECRFYHSGSKQFEFWAGSEDAKTGLQFGVNSLTGGLKVGVNELGVLRGAFSDNGLYGWYYTDIM